MFLQVVRTGSVGGRDDLELRNFSNVSECRQAEDNVILSAPHIRPQSVLVAAIGITWAPGAWQKVTDMVQYTCNLGSCCWLKEFPDRCVTLPYGAINQQRNAACMYAHGRGFEWVLLIDNDILPDPDLILRLQQWGVPVVVPFIKDDKQNVPVACPRYEPNTGLLPVKWAACSCILLSVKVLNCFPFAQPWTDVLVEPDFYDRLAHFGHRTWQDTNTTLQMASNPTYHGGISTVKGKLEWLEQVDAKRRRLPDRGKRTSVPTNSDDKRDWYLPKEWDGIVIPEIGPEELLS